ncbi:putative glutamate receptor [Oratosquilla oratoria]|uniref:putative glutamate receptor n=1 Tax=Oratosquilla oratoria TaxID=337810 RepID=UPI003F76BF00
MSVNLVPVLVTVAACLNPMASASGDVMPPIRSGKPGDCLVIAMEFWPPYQTVTGRAPNPVIFTGAMVEVFKIIAAKLDICYTLVRSPDKYFFGHQTPNGTYTGILGLLKRGEADFCASVFAVSYDRAQQVDFSIPVWIDEWKIVYKRPVIEPDLQGFVKPFTLGVCTVLGTIPEFGRSETNHLGNLIAVIGVINVFTAWGLLFGVAFSLLLCTGILQSTLFFFAPNKPKCSEASITSGSDGVKKDPSVSQITLKTLSSSTMWTIRVLLAQSMIWVPKGNSGRVVGATWLLSVLILSTVYKSNLKAMLIKPRVNIPFTNLEELIEYNKLPWRPIKGSVVHETMKGADPDSLYGRAWAGVYDFLDNLGYYQALKDMDEGLYAGLLNSDLGAQTIHYTFSQTATCPRFMAPHGFLKTNIVATVFPKKSYWLSKINPILENLKESGFLEYLKAQELVNSTHCLKTPGSEKSDTLRPLAIGDFLGVLALYLGGNVLALVALLCEAASAGGKRNTEGLQKRATSRRSTLAIHPYVEDNP